MEENFNNNPDDKIDEENEELTDDSIQISNETESKPEVIPLSLKELKGIIESLLFVSNNPLTVQKIKNTIDEVSDTGTIKAIITELNDEYIKEERSFHIIEVAGGYQIYTRDKFSPWIKKMMQSKLEKKLSNSLIETLSIVAYKQPVTRLEIEAIRGVSVSNALKLLMEKKLIRITGKKEGVGRSLLYGTTKDFLIYFGLKNLEDLPQMNELKEIMKQDNSIS